MHMQTEEALIEDTMNLLGLIKGISGYWAPKLKRQQERIADIAQYDDQSDQPLNTAGELECAIAILLGTYMKPASDLMKKWSEPELCEAVEEARTVEVV